MNNYLHCLIVKEYVVVLFRYKYSIYLPVSGCLLKNKSNIDNNIIIILQQKPDYFDKEVLTHVW